MPQIAPKVDERDSLLEQIRTKVSACNFMLIIPFCIQNIILFKNAFRFSQSFNLKPAVTTRPSIQGPKTNLKFAAILEKANAIRQVCLTTCLIYCNRRVFLFLFLFLFDTPFLWGPLIC